MRRRPAEPPKTCWVGRGGKSEIDRTPLPDGGRSRCKIDLSLVKLIRVIARTTPSLEAAASARCLLPIQAGSPITTDKEEARKYRSVGRIQWDKIVGFYVLLDRVRFERGLAPKQGAGSGGWFGGGHWSL